MPTLFRVQTAMQRNATQRNAKQSREDDNAAPEWLSRMITILGSPDIRSGINHDNSRWNVPKSARAAPFCQGAF
jgi:hypothetical protein